MTSDLVLQTLVGRARRVQACGAFGSGLPVHQQRLQSFLKAHRMVPSMSRRGDLPRQCRGRELLRRPEEEADQAANLPDMRHSELGRVRRHRDVLKPDPQVWFRWRVVTGRV